MILELRYLGAFRSLLIVRKREHARGLRYESQEPQGADAIGNVTNAIHATPVNTRCTFNARVMFEIVSRVRCIVRENGPDVHREYAIRL